MFTVTPWMPSTPIAAFSTQPGISPATGQPGAVSVTNPPTDRVVIPESSRVTKTDAALVIQRQSLSSLVKAGQQVVSDADLRETPARVARLWQAEFLAGYASAAHLAEYLDGQPEKVAAQK